MTGNEQFWDKIAIKYSKKNVPNEEIYQRKLDIIRELSSSEMNCLEVGCGTGSTAIKLANSFKHIKATDFSQKMIEIANTRKTDENIDNVDFFVESVEDMNYQNGSFDVVMSHSILHLVDSHKEALSKIFNILKPDGYFIVSIPCVGEVKWFKYIRNIGHKLGLFPYLQIFTKKDFLDDVKNQGFSIIEEWHTDQRNIFLVLRK